jgi:small conductance mechanosensitive channel
VDRIAEMVSPDRIAALLEQMVPRVLAAILVFLLFWLLQRLTRPALRALLHRAHLHETLIHMLVDNLYKFTIITFGLVSAAGQLGINVTAALAGISIAGIALGFAAQDSLANLVSGFLIFWDKPFLVGDYITVGGQYGCVTEITMRSTRIRTQQNTYVVIPNKHVIDQVVVNHSMYGETRVEVPIGIAYKESIPEARRVLLEAVRSVEHVMETPAPDVVARETAGSSLELLVRVWVDEAKHERPVFFATLEACKLALDRAGIQIPYPHLQVFMDDVEPRVVEKLARLPALAGVGPREEGPHGG